MGKCPVFGRVRICHGGWADALTEHTLHIPYLTHLTQYLHTPTTVQIFSNTFKTQYLHSLHTSNGSQLLGPSLGSLHTGKIILPEKTTFS